MQKLIKQIRLKYTMTYPVQCLWISHCYCVKDSIVTVVVPESIKA